MGKEHLYRVKVKWTGNTGDGTSSYRRYLRDHDIEVEGKMRILGSSDPSFRGDPSRHNPEELLVASLSSCHMLWFLHLCSANKIIVSHYEDHAEGTMTETNDGGGYFEKVILKPVVTITDNEKTEECAKLHREANSLCFVANSVNFPVIHQPVTRVLEN